MSREQDRHAEPHLPPSPMEEPREPPVPDVPLPWTTPLVTVLAGLLPALGSGLLGIYAWGWPLGWWGFRLIVPYAFAAGLLGLGASFVDQRHRSWPRPLRWAVGMGLRGLFPLSIYWVFRTMGTGRAADALLGVLIEIIWTGVGGAGLGLLLGLAARSGRGMFWKLPLAGLGACVAGRMASTIAYDVLLGRHVYVPMVHVPPGLPSTLAHLVFGPLFGLALAERLSSAIRAHQQRTTAAAEE